MKMKTLSEYIFADIVNTWMQCEASIYMTLQLYIAFQQLYSIISIYSWNQSFYRYFLCVVLVSMDSPVFSATNLLHMVLSMQRLSEWMFDTVLKISNINELVTSKTVNLLIEFVVGCRYFACCRLFAIFFTFYLHFSLSTFFHRH